MKVIRMFDFVEDGRKWIDESVLMLFCYLGILLLEVCMYKDLLV